MAMASATSQTRPVAAAAAARRAAMAMLVEGKAAELSELLRAIGELPRYEEIRRAENGLAMVRGRIGGDGAPFNLGEASVARAAIRLTTGEVGFGYVLGRDLQHARLIALCDALLQSERYGPAVERHVLEPIRARRAAERKRAAEHTAATRVDFFTLVRGEDER